jgi:hypothetical protein
MNRRLKLNQSDKREFAKLITDVMAYYRQDASNFTIQLFWNACQSVELEHIQKAFQAHCMDAERGVFPPKVADIVRALSGTVTDRAAMAWGKVLEAMGSVGAYSDVVFDDPAIHAAIEDCGGWVKMCRSQTEELSYLQHRFCQSHKAYTGRGNFEYQRRLIGDRSPDHDYSTRGIPLPKPAVIGDIDKARMVYQGGNAGGKTSISFQEIDMSRALSAPVKLLDAA